MIVRVDVSLVSPVILLVTRWLVRLKSGVGNKAGKAGCPFVKVGNILVVTE